MGSVSLRTAEPMNHIESRRQSFRPERITVLFVGESPPNGGTFFYNEDSLLYREMKESFGASANFLTEFKAKGFFLDDLVLYPINQISDENKRNEERWNGVSTLAWRMADYQPKPTAVVALMCAIKPMVADAMHDAGLSHISLYVAPFPSWPQHQERFGAIMAEIKRNYWW
jgi:hypothetical protein